MKTILLILLFFSLVRATKMTSGPKPRQKKMISQIQKPNLTSRRMQVMRILRKTGLKTLLMRSLRRLRELNMTVKL
ncbi:MAG: hypothetical protein L0Y79_13300 [Chlorobi bacterium]|nr:hypothetical protein [Chlorobiota bacterium]MCI0716253.1 hypothetical protein [Chlorobiota bacterium]